MSEWFKESSRWVDAVIKAAGKESDANATHLKAWHAAWLPEVSAALQPLTEYAFNDGGEALKDVLAKLEKRATKIGL